MTANAEAAGYSDLADRFRERLDSGDFELRSQWADKRDAVARAAEAVDRAQELIEDALRAKIVPIDFEVPHGDGPVEAQAARSAIRMFYGAMGVLEQRQSAIPRIVEDESVVDLVGPFGLQIEEIRSAGGTSHPEYEMVELGVWWDPADTGEV